MWRAAMKTQVVMGPLCRFAVYDMLLTNRVKPRSNQFLVEYDFLELFQVGRHAGHREGSLMKAILVVIFERYG